MSEPSDTTVVGSYLSSEEAERAREHLREVGIGPVEVTRVSDEVWEVTAPRAEHETAVDTLERREQQILRRFF